MQFENQKTRWLFAGPSSNKQEVHLGTTGGGSEISIPGGDGYHFFIHDFPKVNGVKTVAIESVDQPGYYISTASPGLNYSATQVVLSKESSVRLYQAKDKRIWAVTVFGIASFLPDKPGSTETAPFIYISGIGLIEKNKVQANKPDSSLLLNKEFNYLHNSFTFSFAALDYANQEGMRYYYRLEGLDTNWRNSGDQRSVSFQNLLPGNYLFRVKAMNSKRSLE